MCATSKLEHNVILQSYINVETNYTPNKNKINNASISERNNYQAFQGLGCSGGGKSFDQLSSYILQGGPPS